MKSTDEIQHIWPEYPNKEDFGELDRQYITSLQNKALSDTKRTKGRGQGVSLLVNFLAEGLSSNDFISSVLENLSDLGHGHFSQKKRTTNTVQYNCERSRKPRGISQGVSSQTRANDCPAYISFCFQQYANRTAAVIRIKDDHLGHSLHIDQDLHLNKIHADLVDYIERLTIIGKKRNEIVVSCKKWAEERGIHNLHDRRHYPSLEDLKYIMQRTRAIGHLHPNDALSVDTLVKSDLKENIVFYQPLSRSTSSPLVIIYQSAHQKRIATKYGKSIAFVDASYSELTAYGFAFYAVMVRDDGGRGFPVAYMILSVDTEDVLRLAFQKLKETNPLFYPSAFMVDKDMKEIQALGKVFPLSAILLCWFHVLQAVQHWMMKRDSNLSGPLNIDRRADVISFMIKLKQARHEEDFNNLVDQMDIDRTAATYIQLNWVPHAKKWSNFGRTMFHGDSETNNLVERFFLALKYHFLRGFANRRVDDLLLLLDSSVNDYYSYVEGLQVAGRVTLPSSREPEGAKRAEQMLTQGLGDKIVWGIHGKCSVPSSHKSNLYDVNITELKCECPQAPTAGMCKHLNLAITMAGRRGQDVEQERNQTAKRLLESKNYTVQNNLIVVYSDISEDISVFDCTAKHCTCTVASFGFECICQKLWQLIAGSSKETVSTTIVSELQCGQPPTSHKLKTQQLLKELYHWSQGPAFKDTQEIYLAAKKLHSLAFSTFTTKSQKRKIQPWRTYRRQIEKAKRCLLDHQYALGTMATKSKATIERKPDSEFQIRKTAMKTYKRYRAPNMKQVYGSKKLIRS